MVNDTRQPDASMLDIRDIVEAYFHIWKYFNETSLRIYTELI